MPNIVDQDDILGFEDAPHGDHSTKHTADYAADQPTHDGDLPTIPMPAVMRASSLPKLAKSSLTQTPYMLAQTPPPPHPPQRPVRGQRRSPVRFRRDGMTWAMLALIAFAVTVMAGVLGVITLRVIANREGVSSAANQPPTPTLTIPTYAAALPSASQPSGVFDPNQPTLVPLGVDLQAWDGQARFTVLMLGIDKRPNDKGTAFRTDSMILVSIDPLTQSVGMLSIPRDLYVEIPQNTVVTNAYGLQKVNTAYFLGELARPGYGGLLAMQTVQYNLGVRIHDYVVYDFEAITTLIDAVGGVPITAAESIYDPLYPDMYRGYDPLSIQAGWQIMDGAMALKYARTRHGSTDIHRARRQQEVIMALRQRILSEGLIPNLILQAPSLWASLDKHLKSGLSLEQIVRLLLYVKDIQTIRQGVIDFRYVTDVMWSGAEVLVPNRAALGRLLVEVFGANYSGE